MEKDFLGKQQENYRQKFLIRVKPGQIKVWQY